MPSGGGYAGFLQGDVVDMLYFPIIESHYPSWMPFWAGEEFIFFRPVFNIADVVLVVGVGLNIAALASAETRELSSGFACLQELEPAASAPTALHRVALPLIKALHQFEREGFAGFATAYERRDLLRGRRVTSKDPANADGELDG